MLAPALDDVEGRFKNLPNYSMVQLADPSRECPMGIYFKAWQRNMRNVTETTLMFIEDIIQIWFCHKPIAELIKIIYIQEKLSLNSQN